MTNPATSLPQAEQKTRLFAMEEAYQACLTQSLAEADQGEALAQQIEKAQAVVDTTQAEVNRLAEEKNTLIQTIATQQKEFALIRLTQQENINKIQADYREHIQQLSIKQQQLEVEESELLSHSTQATMNCEAQLAALTAAKEQLAQISAKKEENQAPLVDEFQRQDAQLKKATKEASVKLAIRQMERSAAEAALAYAQQKLDYTTAQLEKAEQLLTERQNALDNLTEQLNTENQNLLEEYNGKLAAAQAEALAAQDHLEKQMPQLTKVSSLAKISQEALKNISLRHQKLSQEIRAFYREDERKTTDLTVHAQEAAKRVIEQWNIYNQQRRITQSLAEDVDAIAEAQEEGKTQLAELDIQLQDLQGTATIAADLVQDAKIALDNASSDMRDSLAEMALSLERSAQDAQTLYDVKQAERDQLLAHIRNLTEQQEGKNQELQQAKTALTKAEQNCQAAQKETLEFSEVIKVYQEQRAKTLAEKRNAYEATVKEMKRLKKASYANITNVRNLRRKIEKAKRGLFIATKEASDLQKQKEELLQAQADKTAFRQKEAQAMLELARDVQEKLFTARLQQEVEHKQWKHQLEAKIRQEKAVQEDYDQLLSTGENALAQLRWHLEENQRSNANAKQAAEAQVQECTKQYEACLQEVATITEKLERLQEKALILQKQKDALLQQQEETQIHTEEQFQQENAQMGPMNQALQQKLLQLEATLTKARFTAETAKRKHHQLCLKQTENTICQALFQESKAAAESLLQTVREEYQAQLAAAEEAERQAKAWAEETARQQKQREERRRREAQENAAILALAAEAKQQAEEDAEREKEQTQLKQLILGELLTPTERLELITTDQLENRIQKMKARYTPDIDPDSMRWLDKAQADEIREQARRAELNAQQDKALFTSSRDDYMRLFHEKQSKENRLEELSGHLVALQKEIDTLTEEKHYHQQAIASTQSALDRILPEQEETMRLALEALTEAQEAIENKVQQDQQSLVNGQQEKATLQEEIAQLKTSLQEMETLLDEVTTHWMLSERAETEASVRAIVLEREINDRDAIAKIAAEQFKAAKAYAERSEMLRLNRVQREHCGRGKNRNRFSKETERWAAGNKR